MAAPLRSHDPSAPADLVAEASEPTLAELDSLLDAAAEAQGGWAAGATGRAAALDAFADAIGARGDALADQMVREVGKPVVEARAEVARAGAILRYHAQAALDPLGELLPGSAPGATVVVRREPLGVVLAICPWNFPLAIPIWKAAPALAYGNAVLLKPATPAIGVAKLLAEAAGEALPNGVLAVAPMSGALAAGLLDDDRVDGVTFTGSTSVGLSVAERLARRGAPAQAEMGGQNPAIVLADADLGAAADAIVAGSMSYAGQKCTATRRVIAVEPIAEALAEALAERVRALAVGDPADEQTIVGPLIDADALEQFESRLGEATAGGSVELARAEAPAAEGHFASPALLAADDPAAPVNQEETFGPLLTMLRVPDPERAVEAANATRFGLVGAVHGRDLGRAVEVASRLDCGLQRVNAPTPGVDYYAPFGGERRSSFGPREQGRAARDFFTSSRTITIVAPPGS